MRLVLEENIRSMQERLSLLQESRPEIHSDEKLKEQENRELRELVKELKQKNEILEERMMTLMGVATTTDSSSVDNVGSEMIVSAEKPPPSGMRRRAGGGNFDGSDGADVVS